MNREELDAFFASADDVLDHWPGSADCAIYRAPEVSADWPALPRASMRAQVAAQYGIDGQAADALIAFRLRQVGRDIVAGLQSFAAGMNKLGEQIQQASRNLAALRVASSQPSPSVSRDAVLTARRLRNVGPPQQCGLDGHYRRGSVRD